MRLLLLLGVGAAGYYLYQQYSQGNLENISDIFSGGHKADSSLQIIKERLAKGEITSDEYEKLKATLQ